MIDQFVSSIDTKAGYGDWISVLADNAIRSASGQAADAEFTGDLATSECDRLEYEIELEVDDKLDVLSETRTPFDVLRFTNRSPRELAFTQLPRNKTTTEIALYFAHDALQQDLLEVVLEKLTD